MAARHSGLQHLELPDWIPEVLRTAERGSGGASLLYARTEHGHSNDIAELTYEDGRVLVLKRARHDWVSACFSNAEAAARRLQEETGLDVPQPLPLTQRASAPAVQAYWRIPRPTLAQLWPSLDQRARTLALQSLGRMLRRVHAVRARGFGPLNLAEPLSSLADGLYLDLKQRLLPAVYGHWDAGAYHVERLIALIPRVQRIHGSRAPVLVHNDLHIGNVLCRTLGHSVDCVGLLDLDSVTGSTPEFDLAGFHVLHGRLFCQAIAPELRAELQHGYGVPVDARLLAYFRCVHLANQGFTSGFLGHVEHASWIADELELAMQQLARTGIEPAPEPPLH